MAHVPNHSDFFARSSVRKALSLQQVNPCEKAGGSQSLRIFPTDIFVTWSSENAIASVKKLERVQLGVISRGVLQFDSQCGPLKPQRRGKNSYN